MKPVNQTIHTLNGNCFQACVASVLELPLEKVPHFWENPTEDLMSLQGGLTQEQWDNPLIFARDNGYLARWIDPVIHADFVKQLIQADFYYVAIGPSPGGPWGHCVVMHKGKPVHDPDSPAEFLAGEPWLLFLMVKKPEGESNVMSRSKLLDHS
jgi:hypothetical protein